MFLIDNYYPRKSKKIYFDYAATTPVDSRVMKAMSPFFSEKFGNLNLPFFQYRRKTFTNVNYYVLLLNDI